MDKRNPASTEFTDHERTSAENGNAPVEDRVLKTAAQFFGTELLPILGVREKMIRIAPTEQVYLEMKDFHEDYNYLMEDGTWRHFEFESDRITKADLKRFRTYEAVCSYSYDVEVITSVVCTSRVKKQKAKLQEGLNTYQVQIIRLKDRNADRLIRKLRKKKKAGTLNRQDLVELLLTPLMDGKMPQYARIEESLRLIQGEAERLEKEDVTRMESMLFAFSMKFLKQEELRKIKEVFEMTLLGQMLEERGIEKGIEKGIVKGLERADSLYRRLAETGRTDDILKATQDKEYQKQLFEEFGIK